MLVIHLILQFKSIETSRYKLLMEKPVTEQNEVNPLAKKEESKLNESWNPLKENQDKIYEEGSSSSLESNSSGTFNFKYWWTQIFDNFWNKIMKIFKYIYEIILV